MGTLVIRCDATVEIGAGHFFRQLALAEEAATRDVDVVFAMHRPSQGVREFAARIEAILVDIAGDRASRDDATRLSELAVERNAFAVIVDGYHFGTEYYEALRGHRFCLAATDDLAHHRFPVDLMLSTSPHADTFGYRVLPHTECLLGLDYALLRRQFRDQRRQMNGEGSTGAVERILVTLGGSDPTDETSKVLEALGELEFDGTINVVTGPANPRLEYLEQVARALPSNVEFHSNVIDMAGLMARHDLAICAAGGTSWELCCLGVPMIQLIAADNQQRIAHWLADHGVSELLGWREDVTPEDVAEATARLIGSSKRRVRMHQKGMQLVDARGPQRVLDALLKLANRRNPSARTRE